MGSGKWSPQTYQVRAQQRQVSGQDSFEYSRGATGVHPTLNPAGLETRESRDSDEHPDSNSIIVGLDVSGSMGRVVRAIHKDLPQLFTLLLGQSYIPHPQIMFAAFSNGRCDRVPLQIGQFESDNRMDQHLENMILGGSLAGGCDPEESAELMLYIAARHTSIDCWEKRQRKGYLFLITDEIAYLNVKHEEVVRIIGPRVNKDIPLDTIIAEAREKYHVFVVIPSGSMSGNAQVVEFWRSHLGPAYTVVLHDPEDISEVMALVIGLTEGTITLEQGLEHLKAGGTAASKLDGIGKTLSLVAGQSIKGAGSGLDDVDKEKTKKRTRRLW